MSDGHLDWCLVDALTFREIAGYEATLAVIFPKPWTSGWVFGKLFEGWIPLLLEVVIAVAAASWLRAEFLSPDASSYRWIWTVSIAVYYVWVFARVPGWIRSLKVRQKLMSETVGRLQAMQGMLRRPVRPCAGSDTGEGCLACGGRPGHPVFECYVAAA